MAFVGFRNTHNNTIYINPEQVIYVSSFEEDVTIVAYAVTDASGKPVVSHVRGSADIVQHKLASAAAR
ncbi:MULTISPECIES: hypothetical protein [Rhizobium]|jgi:hypothetical protein|uniref:Uncharacterized protein n=1 Tax=Rhizobium altiplani TaxID=1864509 RepID=A0A109JKF8_9HYPH|nr:MULTISPECIES: hypothetical protein [Rhizobium]KWV50712.1 hypothetical protein AS026_08060 [Rhizobium altiplani]MBD9445245.1 hypothetical protein [Rhizobium sp. RHZ01]MBD9452958.1 hypothetical protein [Rhizobium sp. RHZ02]NMN69135.1 hypothetical protein [Rhizobium sp. 57MFTsu3.2]